MERKKLGDRQGKEIWLYSWKNAKGSTMTVTNYGATICSLFMPDREGAMTEVLLGFADPMEYIDQATVYGSTIGPVANRIAKGKFAVDGVEYTTHINENEATTLHSGPEGFQNKVWDAEIQGETLHLHYFRPDGEGGFPGNMNVDMDITLTDEDALRLEYRLTSDKKTPMNITNHAYFNLAGKGDIYGHIVQLEADAFTPANNLSLPTGEIAPVEGTPFDFRERRVLGEQMDQSNEQIAMFGGFDHNYVIRGEGFRKAGMFLDPASGRGMDIYTDLPAMQLYSDNRSPGKEKVHMSCCFETQFFPDSMHHPNFPDSMLKPGERFETKTEYRFFAE